MRCYGNQNWAFPELSYHRYKASLYTQKDFYLVFFSIHSLLNYTFSWMQCHGRKNITVKSKLSSVLYDRMCCWWDSRGRRGGSGPRGQMQPSSYQAGHHTHEHSPGGPAATSYCPGAQTTSSLTLRFGTRDFQHCPNELIAVHGSRRQTRVQNTNSPSPIKRILLLA